MFFQGGPAEGRFGSATFEDLAERFFSNLLAGGDKEEALCFSIQARS